jgi:hypothetical protein
MTEPENSPPNVSPQLSNVQNSLYSAIQFAKKQQWAITNYVILVYAAIFALSRWMNNPNTTPQFSTNERWGLSILIGIAWVYATGLLVQIQWDLRGYRKQLEAFHNQTISKEDRARYELKPYEFPFFRGGWFLAALLGVVLIGAGLVIYTLWRA